MAGVRGRCGLVSGFPRVVYAGADQLNRDTRSAFLASIFRIVEKDGVLQLLEEIGDGEVEIFQNCTSCSQSRWPS